MQTNAATPSRQADGAGLSAARGQTPLEFLSFTLGDEEYGIDIQKVQELRGYDAVTRIANAPEYIKGVVNLRGIIVPIIDMRIKFCAGHAELRPVHGGDRAEHRRAGGGHGGGQRVGRDHADAPSRSSRRRRWARCWTRDYLIGLGTLDERMLILVDIDKLMSSDEMGLIEKMAA